MRAATWGTGNYRAIVILGTFMITGCNKHLGSSKKGEARCWVFVWRLREACSTLGNIFHLVWFKWLGASRGKQSLSEKFIHMKLLLL